MTRIRQAEGKLRKAQKVANNLKTALGECCYLSVFFRRFIRKILVRRRYSQPSPRQKWEYQDHHCLHDHR